MIKLSVVDVIAVLFIACLFTKQKFAVTTMCNDLRLVFQHFTKELPFHRDSFNIFFGNTLLSVQYTTLLRDTLH